MVSRSPSSSYLSSRSPSHPLPTSSVSSPSYLHQRSNGRRPGLFSVYYFPLFFLILLHQSYGTHGYRITGTVTIQPDTLTYITDFCYGTEGGMLEYNVVTDLASGLVIYSAENWNYVTTHSCNCSCLQDYTLDQTIHFLVPGGNGDTGQITISTPEQKPAYIYTAFLTCAEATKVNYQLHFTRNVPSSLWPEIPYDAVGLLETNAISTSIACAITLILLCRYNWWSQKHWYLTPPPVKVFGLACVLWLASSACILTHFITFAHDGYGQANVEGFGRVADVLSRLVFMGLLLALARGWDIIQDQLQPESNNMNGSSRSNNNSGGNGNKNGGGSSRGNVAFRRRCGGIVLIGSLAAIYIIMAVWYLVERLPGDVTYVYDSVPGITVSIVQAITGLWYGFDSRSTINTLQNIMKSKTSNNPNNLSSSSISYMYGSSTFSAPYISMQINWLKTALIFLLYFAALPIVVLISYVGLPNYNDEKTVEATLQTSRVIFYGLLLYLFSPSRTERLFSTWQPENSVVKLLRPEISSVDLLTPVLSGYASPGGMYTTNNNMNMNGLPMGRTMRRGPGSGYASGSRTPKQQRMGSGIVGNGGTTRTSSNSSNNNVTNTLRYGSTAGTNSSTTQGKMTSTELPYIHEEGEEKEHQSLLAYNPTDSSTFSIPIGLSNDEAARMDRAEQDRLEEKEERKRKKLAKKEKKKEKEKEKERQERKLSVTDGLRTVSPSNEIDNETLTNSERNNNEITNSQSVLHNVLEQEFFRETVSPTKERGRTNSNIHRHRTESGSTGGILSRTLRDE